MSERRRQRQQTEDTACGLPGCYPQWLSPLARVPFYFLSLFMLLLMQGVMKTYIFGMITTIERRFDLNSQQLGVIITMDNIGNLGTILFMAHFGGRAKRPLVMGVGMMVTAVGAFIMTVPHYVFGPGQTRFGPEEDHTGSDHSYLCNMSTPGDPPLGPDAPDCQQQHFTSTEGSRAQAIMCTGFLLYGAGGAALYSLGVSYLDDNVHRKKAPLLIGIINTGRFVGPVLGFLVFSAFSRVFIDLNPDPGITESDPRWVGAWWLGLLTISIVLFCTSLPMLCFPRYMSNSNKEAIHVKADTPCAKPDEKLVHKLKGFLLALLRLIKNPVYIIMSAAISVDLWSASAVFSFQPKYIQNQFGISAADASLYGGAIALSGGVIGSIIGGYVIKRLRLDTKGATLTCVVSTAAFGIFCIIMLFVGCPNRSFPGTMEHNGQWNFTSACNADCHCSQTSRFSPVCRDGITYFTPCHAGCSGKANLTDNAELTYTNCSCVSATDEDVGANGGDLQSATEGFCTQDDCSDTLKLYLAVLFVAVSLGGVVAVGGVVVKLRCVAVEDKPLALGLSSFLYSFFAFIPAPIVIGSLIDKSCTYWSLDACGEQGACWIYDNDQFRHYIYGCGAVVKSISTPLYILAMWRCPGPWRLQGDTDKGDTSAAAEEIPMAGHTNTTRNNCDIYEN